MGNDKKVKEVIDFYDHFKKMDFIERPTWDEYFMAQAFAVASRASCLKFATGAVIVKNNEILSMGYNGAAKGVESCYERFMRGMGPNACYKTENNISDDHKNSGRCKAINAGENGIQRINIKQEMGATMYSLIYPCNECSRRIVNKGIAELVYTFDYVGEEREEAQKRFDEVGLNVRYLDLSPERFFEILSRPWALYANRVSREDFERIGSH